MFPFISQCQWLFNLPWNCKKEDVLVSCFVLLGLFLLFAGGGEVIIWVDYIDELQCF